jgi:O-antigen/teichoic acid export membrane protein
MKKQALIHYGGYILSSIGALFGVSLLSHIVTADTYGKIALYIAIATLFQTIVREALSNALMRHASEIQQNKFIALNLIKNAKVPIIICYIVICMFCYFWVNAESSTELILSFLLILSLGCTVVGEAFLSALLKRGAYAIHLNIIQWLRFPLAALFFYYFKASTSSILIGFILAFIVAAIFDFIIWKNIRPHQPKQDVNPIDFNIFSGYTPILIGFFVWFTTFYDRLAIEKIHGEDMLGIYFVLIQIAYMPVIVLMRSSANFLFPLLYNQNKKMINKKMILIITSLFFSVWSFLQLTHQWIFSWLVGEQYREYSWLLSWLFLAAVLNAVAYLFQARFYQAHTMKTLLLIRGLTALLYFCTVTLFAWLYAIEGLVFANVCVSIFLIILSYYFGRNNKLIVHHTTASVGTDPARLKM